MDEGDRNEPPRGPPGASDEDGPISEKELAWLVGILREHFARGGAPRESRYGLASQRFMALLSLLFLGGLAYSGALLSRLAALVDRTAGTVERITVALNASRREAAQEEVYKPATERMKQAVAAAKDAAVMQAVEVANEALTGGLDGGTSVVEMLRQATPMSKRPLPLQRPAPCPKGIDEFNGYCWSKWTLTPAQVEAGACDDDALFEPSPGWCVQHHEGYRPYRGGRRPGRSVDPQ